MDVTLVISDGSALWMGTGVDATPEASWGDCHVDAAGLDRHVRLNRTLLARVLGRAGLVNYPTEWWHWSFGDRYWAFTTHHRYSRDGASLSTAALLDALPEDATGALRRSARWQSRCRL